MPRPGAPKRTQRDPALIAALGIILAWSLAPSALAQPAPGGAAPGGTAPPPGVMVETVAAQDIADQASFTGRIEAIDRVELRARVEGFLRPRQFEEGSEVEKGALLFVIEKAPYEAAVAEAKANVASAEAQVVLAKQTFDRIKELTERNAVAQSQLDEAAAQLQEREAALQGQRAALDIAELNLSYTKVHAPVAGRIGKAAFSEGNLVGPDSGALATLAAQDPMNVAFPVPQRMLLQVQREQRAREAFVVHLKLSDGSIYQHPGEILYADVEANPSTDTVTVRARVPNPKRLLFDRQLVGVVVEEKQPAPRLVISQSALLLDQQGSYVLVVKDDDTVEARRIETGAQRGPDVIVEAGLKAGERVITSGMQKVRPGMTVSPQQAAETGGEPAEN